MVVLAESVAVLGTAWLPVVPVPVLGPGEASGAWQLPVGSAAQVGVRALVRAHSPLGQRQVQDLVGLLALVLAAVRRSVVLPVLVAESLQLVQWAAATPVRPMLSRVLGRHRRLRLALAPEG